MTIGARVIAAYLGTFAAGALTMYALTPRATPCPDPPPAVQPHVLNPSAADPISSLVNELVIKQRLSVSFINPRRDGQPPIKAVVFDPLRVSGEYEDDSPEVALRHANYAYQANKETGEKLK